MPNSVLNPNSDGVYSRSYIPKSAVRCPVAGTSDTIERVADLGHKHPGLRQLQCDVQSGLSANRR